MVEEFQKRGRDYLRFACECGQKQESLKPESGPVKCARCGAEHTPDA